MSDDVRPPELATTRSAHFAALAFAMLFPTAATALYFVALSGSRWMQFAYFGSKVVQFAFPVFWVLAVERRRLRPARPNLRSVVVGLVTGGAIAAAGFAAYFGYLKGSPYLQHAPDLVTDKVSDMGLSSPAVYLAFAVFLSLPHSFLEEYYWRWFVFGQLRRVSGRTLAIGLSSLAFAAHHVVVIQQFVREWPTTLALSLCVAVGGCLWAWLYERHRTLYAPWMSHLLVDCGIMLLGYDLISW